LIVLLLVVVLILALGALPQWPYASRYNYGYGPSGLLGLLLIVLLVLLLLGRL